MGKELLYFFTAHYPFGTGETFIETEIQYLAPRFESIVVIPHGRPVNRIQRSVPANVIVAEPIFPRSRIYAFFLELFNMSPIVFIIKELFNQIRAGRQREFWKVLTEGFRIRRLLAYPLINQIRFKKHFSVVFYFYWGYKSASIIPFLNSEDQKKTIVRFHRGDLYEADVVEDGLFYFRAQLLRTLGWAAFISNHGERYLRKKYSNISFNSKVFRLGVNDNGIARQSSDDIVRVVSCSNVIAHKRVDLIYRVLNQVGCRISWTHFGEGDQFLALQNEIALSKSDCLQVNLKGNCSNMEVMRYYQNESVDLFLHLSTSEGIPVAIMEALSFGVPVVATDVGGISELIDDQVGALIRTNCSSGEIEEILYRFFSLPVEAKQKLRQKARNRWTTCANASTLYTEFAEFTLSLST
jgi:colanic acid/amylovoran biosynthesis glycosyltransferase